MQKDSAAVAHHPGKHFLLKPMSQGRQLDAFIDRARPGGDLLAWSSERAVQCVWREWRITLAPSREPLPVFLLKKCGPIRAHHGLFRCDNREVSASVLCPAQANLVVDITWS